MPEDVLVELRRIAMPNCDSVIERAADEIDRLRTENVRFRVALFGANVAPPPTGLFVPREAEEGDNAET